MTNTTIASIATGTTNAGISIIRLSGSKSLEIASKMLPKLDVSTMEPRKMYLTKVTYQNTADYGLVVYFPGPKSFTGEDVVEFHLHGGQTLTQHMLNGCIECGAVLAMPGEYSKRAFLNGKMSLESCEGVIDIINAQSSAELSAGYNLLSGSLKAKTDAIQNKLTDILAEVEVSMDYPEEDLELQTEEKIKGLLKDVQKNISNLIDTSRTGQILKNGINVAIIGKPNVGKSSLFNAMLNYNRAIVTEISGTTRDTLEESYEHKTVRVNLIDTAGIRESDNKIEQIGIVKSKESLKSCNLVLAVVDQSAPFDELDEEIVNILKNVDKPIILVANKMDALTKEGCECVKKYQLNLPITCCIHISALKNESIMELKDAIYNLTLDKNIDTNALFITNTRHLQCLKEAARSLENAINSIGSISLDCLALDLKDAWNALALITGKVITEEVIDSIFSKFCVGK